MFEAVTDIIFAHAGMLANYPLGIPYYGTVTERPTVIGTARVAIRSEASAAKTDSK